MDISYTWLSQYVDHDEDPHALAETLTMGGLEVEGVSEIGQALDGVVVGEVLEVRAHPNADRLVLCDVELGDMTTAQIACGADNVAAGQMVPVATPGTTLRLPSQKNPSVREPITIESRRVRGEVSDGMICAEDELGLSDDHAGIMVLDDDAAIGQSFMDYLAERGIDAHDFIFDIGLTPNRPDAASHFGVARDVAALTDGPLHHPEVSLPEDGGPAADAVSIDIQAPEGCPRYVAMLVKNVTVQESPLWLKRRLMSIGLRPRNNVVDVTNFVLHEIGQPLHAFDFDRIADQQIVVRETTGEEEFTTLDDVERTLPEGTLLICDAEQPVAVAGVMGGANSEVSDDTTNVLIESAYFDPSSIRRTAKALGLQTDSSYRFERGVDRDGQVWAAARAAELIAELGEGTIVPGMVDAHPAPPSAETVALRPNRLNDVLGVTISPDKATFLLEKIGFEVTRGDDALHCTVPTFRPDVSIEEDLIEEVARLHGYDQIPEPAQITIPGRMPKEAARNRLRDALRELLRGRGFRETYTNSMLQHDEAERFNQPPLVSTNGNGTPAIVETMNPISREMAALRPTLLPGLLEVMQHNQNHGQRALRFFEFGRVFHRAAPEADTLVPGFDEHEALILALSGPHAPMHWDGAERSADFFDLKGAVQTLLDTLRIDDVTIEPAGANTPELLAYHVTVTADGAPLGLIGRVADAVAADFDLDAPAFIAELDWSAIAARAELHEDRTYTPVSRFPVVERDIAVLIHTDQAVGPLLDSIREEGAPLVQDTAVFDIYEGEGIPSDQKSVAIALRFGADRTLTDDEVDAALGAIVTALEQQYDAQLRQ